MSNKKLVNGKWKYFCAALVLMYAGNVAADESGPNLWDAAMLNKMDIVKSLVENGADVNFFYDTSSVLAKAASHLNVDMVKYLLEKGADPNKVHEADFFSRTPLMEAADHCFLDSSENALKVMNLLLEHGADVNATDNHKQTALIFAAIAGNLDVVKLLLEKGANVNDTDAVGRTALDYAAEERRVEIVKFLKEKGAKSGFGKNYDGIIPRSLFKNLLTIVESGDINKVKEAIENLKKSQEGYNLQTVRDNDLLKVAKESAENCKEKLDNSSKILTLLRGVLDQDGRIILKPEFISHISESIREGKVNNIDNFVSSKQLDFKTILKKGKLTELAKECHINNEKEYKEKEEIVKYLEEYLKQKEEMSNDAENTADEEMSKPENLVEKEMSNDAENTADSENKIPKVIFDNFKTNVILNNIEGIKKLVDRIKREGYDPNTKYEGYTMIKYAQEKGKSDIVNYLKEVLVNMNQ